jgi:N6-L-threonylcarbamoyladenine synthase
VTGAARTVVLALETSCDETSAAVVCDGRALLGHVILSQDAHAVFGGVVPEIAARAHLVAVDAVVDAALRQAGVKLRDVTVLAATAGPGLIGALLVGVTWAKAAAWAIGRPFVPVHHMEAHLFGTALEDPAAEPPFVALLVSGGHTMLLWVPAWGTYHLLGETRDDAAGEAFDKVARLLGLPYPGGPQLAALAEQGEPERFDLPRPLENQGLDMSFSGLKTAVRLTIDAQRAADGGLSDRTRADVAASFQAAVVDTLTGKCRQALEATGLSSLVVAGGVGANSALRKSLAALGRRVGVRVYYPKPHLCTDNGAMIAYAGWCRRVTAQSKVPRIVARPRWPLDELTPPS